MSKRLMGHEVPEAMHRMATGIVARGGRVFICQPEGNGSGSCRNCNGWGHFMLQHMTGGPWDSPPGGAATSIDGDWYQVETHQYNCPVCHGNGRPTKARQGQYAEVKL